MEISPYNHNRKKLHNYIRITITLEVLENYNENATQLLHRNYHTAMLNNITVFA